MEDVKTHLPSGEEIENLKEEILEILRGEEAGEELMPNLVKRTGYHNQHIVYATTLLKIEGLVSIIPRKNGYKVRLKE